MNFATRLNSFLKREGQTLETVLVMLGSIEGITHVDLNYPEHFTDHTVNQIEKLLNDNHLMLNGLGIRFEDILVNGEFTNSDENLAQQAIKTCIDAVNLCRRLEGKIVTVWQAYDAFDYPFQIDYSKAWDRMVGAIREIADAASPEILVSIEYKPFQPRSFSLVPNIATTMLLIDDISRPNVGATLDFCHMLMAGENPAASLAMTASRGRLLGVHLNDGYRLNDDGLMAGSVHLLQTVEFLYYAMKYDYQYPIYFDTFPVRENPDVECRQNIKTIRGLIAFIKELGIEEIEKLVAIQSGTTSTKILHQMLNLH